MAIYTGVADANGDFLIPFSTEYTSGQKITVTAEKDSAIKAIELYAPSDALGGGVIQFSGTTNNFPSNIGNVTLSAEITGYITANCFAAAASDTKFGNFATGLSIKGAVTEIRANAFSFWQRATFLNLPNELVTLRDSAFSSWIALLEIKIPNNIKTIEGYCFESPIACKKITLGSSLLSIGTAAFRFAGACDEMICLPTIPPTITTNTFQNLKATCVIKVPSASLAAYQAATNWSAHASKMIGV
mgnify:CR=1 FL=1